MSEGKFLAIVAAAMVGVVFLFGAASLWLASVSCHSQWEGSGMKSEWLFIGGCKVQRKDGTWVPASAVRDLAP